MERWEHDFTPLPQRWQQRMAIRGLFFGIEAEVHYSVQEKWTVTLRNLTPAQMARLAELLNEGL